MSWRDAGFFLAGTWTMGTVYWAVRLWTKRHFVKRTGGGPYKGPSIDLATEVPVHLSAPEWKDTVTHISRPIDPKGIVTYQGEDWRCLQQLLDRCEEQETGEIRITGPMTERERGLLISWVNQGGDVPQAPRREVHAFEDDLKDVPGEWLKP